MPKPNVKMPRTERRSTYEAVLDVNRPAQEGQGAYAIAKFTYSVKGEIPRPIEPEPLSSDFMDPDQDPPLAADTDFWPYKYATDFVVQGSAWAPGGVALSYMEVGVEVGAVMKRAAVFGRREIRWLRRGLRIGDPEPFTEVPLTWANAYGGADWRVPFRHEDLDGDPMMASIVAEVDHPGLYPRNPFGRGYLVEPGEVPDMLMPNVEDPLNLLTPERLVTGDPSAWWRQPLPWCFDWVSPATFPRYVWLDPSVDAWFPGPEDDQLREVARGYLMPRYRTYMNEHHDPDDGPATTFYQGASHGLVLEDLRGGEQIRLYNMHPERQVIAFRLPDATPTFRFFLEGKPVDAAPRLHSIICKPTDEVVSLVYAADTELHRSFVPGVHKRIPIAVSIDGGEPVAYQAPPTVKDTFDAALARAHEG